MTDDGADDCEQLKRAHEDVTITAPRWVFDILIGSAEAIADSDAASDGLRRDCSSAATIAQNRLDKVDSDEDGDA